MEPGMDEATARLELDGVVDGPDVTPEVLQKAKDCWEVVMDKIFEHAGPELMLLVPEACLPLLVDPSQPQPSRTLVPPRILREHPDAKVANNFKACWEAGMALLLKEMILVRDSRAKTVVGVEESSSTTRAHPTRARIPGSVVEQDQGYKI